MDDRRRAAHDTYWRDTYAMVEDVAIRATHVMPGLQRSPALLFALLCAAHDNCLTYSRIEEHFWHLTSERPSRTSTTTAARRLRRALREHPDMSARVRLRAMKGLGYALVWAAKTKQWPTPEGAEASAAGQADV